MALQHPEFDKFKLAYKQSRFESALDCLAKLIIEYPQSFALHWHKAQLLEKLERFDDARHAVSKALKLRPDFIPGLIMQVQLDLYETPEDAGAQLSDDEQLAQDQARFASMQLRLRNILTLDKNSVEALQLLSALLRSQNGEEPLAEAHALLSRAITLAPERVDLLEDRANTLLASASLPPDPEHNPVQDPAVVVTFSGMRYSRHLLEASLADFSRCYTLSQMHRYGLRVGTILHDLGRFDEALAAYDEVLAKVPAHDPLLPVILERRVRSENNGASEREQMAKLMEATIAAQGSQVSNPEGDTLTETLLSAASAVRRGKSVTEALETRSSDDPDENIAIRIAKQVMNIANEPAPELTTVYPEDYPPYQRNFVESCKRDLTALGLQHVGDVESKGMQVLLEERVLLSLFADDAGAVGVTCYALQPPKPDLFNLLRSWLKGQWKTVYMIECISHFQNGEHLSTRYEDGSVFEYGAPIFVETLPANTSRSKLIQHHLDRIAEYKRVHPHVEPLRAWDMAGMEERWHEAQKVKRAYRTHIGYVTEPELRRLLGEHYDKFAAKVKTKIKLMAAGL